VKILLPLETLVKNQKHSQIVGKYDVNYLKFGFVIKPETENSENPIPYALYVKKYETFAIKTLPTN